MPIYLETNALRKLTNYQCDDFAFTSIFSIFELISGITEDEYEVRKACLQRIKKQKLAIRGPMIDKAYMQFWGETGYNKLAYKSIMKIFNHILKSKKFSDISDFCISIQVGDNPPYSTNALEWVRSKDKNLTQLITKTDMLFENEDVEYLRKVFNRDGIAGFARHFWQRYYETRIDENRLAHVEPFVGEDETEQVRKHIDSMFSKYNFKLFAIAQAAIFAKAYFINGNKQNKNNPSDLLHLLYLSEKDILISNDKIYQDIKLACEDFNHIHLENEKQLSDLLINRSQSNT